MIFTKVNIKSELIKERSRQEKLLFNAQKLLEEAAQKDELTISRLKNKIEINSGELDIENGENVFSIDEIKKICIRYRLRFLSSGYFKAEFPYGAISDIQEFERKNNVAIKSFHIIAPAEAFDLENINKDPLLFIPLAHNRFYLIHQWGKELKWHRRIFSWPLQSFKNLLMTLLCIGTIFAFSLPSSVMNVFTLESSIYLRLWLSLHTFIGLFGMTIWFGLAFDISFSEMNWKSKYYNY